MAVERDHDAAVTAWLRRAPRGHTVESLLQAFEDAFAALWQRSHLTLGEITLTAIVERVLHTAKEQFPFLLGSVNLGVSGLDCRELRSHPGLRADDVAASIRFLLVEFLTVLGNLTAQILTPALHGELSKRHADAQDHGITEDEPR